MNSLAFSDKPFVFRESLAEGHYVVLRAFVFNKLLGAIFIFNIFLFFSIRWILHRQTAHPAHWESPEAALAPRPGPPPFRALGFLRCAISRPGHPQK
jgi:hypothetical protein